MICNWSVLPCIFESYDYPLIKHNTYSFSRMLPLSSHVLHEKLKVSMTNDIMAMLTFLPFQFTLFHVYFTLLLCIFCNKKLLDEN